MSIFDQLKNQTRTAARATVQSAVRTAATAVGSKQETFTFTALPESAAQLQALPEAAMDTPFKTAALAVCALCAFAADAAIGTEMLNVLRGPRPMNGQDISFVKDRFRGGARSYIIFSHFAGATPETGYTPTQPYTLTDTPDDPAFPSAEVSGSAMDLGAGIYYVRGRLYAGVSAQHLNAPTVELGERSNFNIDPTYYFTAGYNIKLKNPFISIQPSALVQYNGDELRADITAIARYTHDKKMLYGGVGCSPTNSVTVYVGGNFHGIRLGYSYEIYTSAISMGNGSHEICVGYQTDINIGKKGRNLHKSVRLL